MFTFKSTFDKIYFSFEILSMTISSRDKRVLDTLRLIAEDIPPINSSRIAAAIVISGKVISLGHNQKKTHPMQSRFRRYSNIETNWQHAEIAAISNALKKIHPDELKKATLYIARRKSLNKEWVDGNCCPCKGCQSAINYYGIKRVVHTSDHVV